MSFGCIQSRADLHHYQEDSTPTKESNSIDFITSILNDKSSEPEHFLMVDRLLTTLQERDPLNKSVSALRLRLYYRMGEF